MDIVARLKKFISSIEVPVTQFADTCNIPRPTLSQLLNGRNKKVSDELIGKIHDAYPNLSVLWLMFGEGDMLYKKNIEISEPKTGSIFDFHESQESDNKQHTQSIEFEKSFTNSVENSSQQQNGNQDPALLQNQNVESPDEVTDDTSALLSFPVSSEKKKKIVNIIVYYNDNSFESFVPNPNS